MDATKPNLATSLYALYLAIPRFIDGDSDAPNLHRPFVHDGTSYRATLHPAPSREIGAASRRYLGPNDAAIERALHTLAIDPETGSPMWQFTAWLSDIANQLAADGIDTTLWDISASLRLLAQSVIELTTEGDATQLVITPIQHMNLIAVGCDGDAQATVQFNPLIALPD
jgi:hypothetical protein